MTGHDRSRSHDAPFTLNHSRPRSQSPATTHLQVQKLGIAPRKAFLCHHLVCSELFDQRTLRLEQLIVIALRRCVLLLPLCLTS